MNIRSIVIVVAIVAGSGSTAARGQTPTPPAAAVAKPGSIIGRITAADTGKPLRRAHVTLIPVSPSADAPPITANTNSRGQYEAKNVPPSSYFVSARRAGYLNVQYGQRRPREKGLPVEVRAGQAVDRIDLVLPRGGVLAGTITDELGEPYPGVRVDALAMRYNQGRREPFPVGVATTDDLGQFRIVNLEPGSYYVSASSTETWRTEKKETYGYPSTYFPGGPIDQAELVTLATSEVKSDLHFRLQASRAARVVGRVQRETGEPVAGEQVSLAYSYPGVIMTAGMRSVRTEADGSFVIKDVTPGVYRVGGGSADQIVTVAGTDMEGLLLVPKTGSTVSGTLVADDGAPPVFASSGVRILLDTWSEKVLPTVRVVSVDTDWSFKLTNLGGPFLFRVLGIPDDWMLGSVRFGDKDITDTPWDVPTGGREFTGLQVVVTQKVGRVSGAVLDSDGKPTSAATVVVFPKMPTSGCPVRDSSGSRGPTAMAGSPSAGCRPALIGRLPRRSSRTGSGRTGNSSRRRVTMRSGSFSRRERRRRSR